MAAPNRNRVSDAATRAKIQTTQLIKRLQDSALGKIELESNRIKAIEILLRKTLPDLSQTTLVGDPNSPLQTVNRIELVDLGSGTGSPTPEA